MTEHNLRHLRVFVATVETASVTAAAKQYHLSQPAVTQAIGKVEHRVGTELFTRTASGLFANALGTQFSYRISRALSHLDIAAQVLAPRVRLSATVAQLRALIAVRETENFSLAARRLELAQPTVHRAVGQLEDDALRPLFERTAGGIRATKAGVALAKAASLAFAELAQAEMEIGDAMGQEVGRIVIGTTPLPRSVLLPNALVSFRQKRPRMPVRIIDGQYSSLLSALRRGEIDLLVGALREPLPISDVIQSRLFDDTLSLIARPGHPLATKRRISCSQLSQYSYVVAEPGTPTRQHFDQLILPCLDTQSSGIIESSSLVLMREILRQSNHIGCISHWQSQEDIHHGLLTRLNYEMQNTTREIGITVRVDWEPTAAQSDLLDALRNVV